MNEHSEVELAPDERVRVIDERLPFFGKAGTVEGIRYNEAGAESWAVVIDGRTEQFLASDLAVLR
jgi:hypothetical protein